MFLPLTLSAQYWIGPNLGSLLAVVIYMNLKGWVAFRIVLYLRSYVIVLSWQYWTLSPGQDSCNVKDSPDCPVPSIMRTVTRPQESAV
jgi:hypothetical protein